MRALAWATLGAALAAIAAAWALPTAAERTVGVAIGFLAFQLRTFTPHALVVSVVGALILLAWRSRTRRAWALAAVGVLAGALGMASGRGAITRADPGPAIRVMSINLLATNASASAVAGTIRDHAPDVVVFQEYTDAWDRELYIRLHNEYQHTFRPRPRPWGQAVYSRLALLDRRAERLTGDDYYDQLRVRVLHAGLELEIWNTHLCSPGSPRAVEAQHRQADALAARVLESRVPLIVVGDFNATPRTHTTARLRASGLAEAHATAGSGRGDTWPALGALRLLPGMRIDHAFATRDLAWIGAGVVGGLGSDHRAIVVDAAWTSAPGIVPASTAPASR